MVCALVCAGGMWINANTILNGFFMSIAVMMGIGYLSYQIASPYKPENERMGFMWALAFCMGFLVGPAMHQICEFDPSIIMNAVFITGVMFASFTAVSVYSKRRSYLFLGGIISSLMSAMFMYRLFSWITGYGSMYGMGYLMISLLVACMYIIYDTQMIIERCEVFGERDVPKHTMILFMDLFDLFIKIVQLLLELQKNQEKKKKRDD